MSQSRKLIKNTLVYAIGNIGSKVLAYVMVLVYSHFITADDLGYYDLILTTIAMIQPIIIFQISDGVYRFVITSDEDKRKKVFATSFKFLCLTTFISEGIFLLINLKYDLRFANWISLYLFTTLFYFYFHDAIRACGESRKYALIGILNSVIMLLVEIVGLFLLHIGVLALISANVVSMAICIIIMLVQQPQFHFLLKTKFDYSIFKELIAYSAPLVPNTICWWIVNSSDRYIILVFLGSQFNGIYAISNKFPTILTTITGIFYLAWQEAAIKEYNSPNRDFFFSSIFKKYYTLLLSLCFVAIPMTHIVIESFIGNDYKSAWTYSGFLYLGAVFSALCSFLGLGYQISKETRRSVITTVFAACINVLINIVLIRIIGLQAASLSTFIAYLFLFGIRIKHTKRYFSLHVNWVRFCIMLGSVLITLFVTNIFQNFMFSVTISVVGCVYILIINKELFIPILNKIRG